MTVAPDCFADLDPEDRLHVHGVDYGCISMPDGGELYLTRYGWPVRDQLLPCNWYDDNQYARRGVRMSFSTGHVYRICSLISQGSLDLVVKFSRMAQHVPVVDENQTVWRSSLPLDAAEFNSPFEEIGLLMELRESLFGPPDLRIMTKRPLGIYCPPRRYQAWQTGRSTSVFHRQASRVHQSVRRDETHRRDLQLDIARDYVVLFAWLKGFNAEELMEMDIFDAGDLNVLARMVMNDLRLKGFVVLDHKPNHVILRLRRGGQPLRRNGKLVYAMVDFELLKRTGDYLAFIDTKGLVSGG